MNSVIKSENYRFARSKEVKIIALVQIAYIVLKTGFILAVKYVPYLHELFGDAILSLISGDDFFDSFPAAANGILFRSLMIIMIASLITKLYQSGVAKQLVSSGIRRSQVILGEFVSLTLTFTFICLVISIVHGISDIMLGGAFGVSGGNYLRLLLAVIGMILIVANVSALYMLFAHTTGSMGAAIALSLAVEVGGSMAVEWMAMLFKAKWISKYYFGSVQDKCIVMTGSVTTQLINMAVLCAYTLVFILLCQVIFAHKDVK